MTEAANLEAISPAAGVAISHDVPLATMLLNWCMAPSFAGWRITGSANRELLLQRLPRGCIVAVSTIVLQCYFRLRLQHRRFPSSSKQKGLKIKKILKCE
ncbi:hypothetical protein TIFTF001_014568 [Ficus carica]|uniref:Uncharacterized protein n=1 Tax=Ficus carica TaxID=3494 RepID=A0AA88A6A1_FICCA|nr:hypothetical protein TIFTF001_014568 [Ficus carica]